MSTSSTSHPDARPAIAGAPDRLVVNARKQLKYLVMGAVGCWYWQVYEHLRDVTLGGGWTSTLAFTSLGLLGVTVATFGYLMLLSARGTPPDYQRWNKDPALSSLIPLLTFCIVTGWITLSLTLSPLVAPSPPSPALTERLLEAARSAGGSVQSATSGAQLLLADLGRTLGLSDSTPTSYLKGASLLHALHLPDSEALARRLGVSPDRAGQLLHTLERAQDRAQSWKVNNVSALGWVGALSGAAAAYIAVFGAVGVVGLAAPPRKVERNE